MSNQDGELAVRLAPRLKALHDANGGNWEATSRDALALIRKSDKDEPPSSGSTPDHAAETPDIPREDD